MTTASTPAGQQTIKHHNLALVLRLIADSHHDSGVSRANIAAVSGLTRATVSSLVDELITIGLVIELAPERQARGRPSSPLLLNRDAPVGLGIEINVGYVAACAVDVTGEVRAHSTRISDGRTGSPEQTSALVAEVVEEVYQQIGAESLQVYGIGVGVPGTVDHAGVLRRAPNLQGWDGVPVESVLRSVLPPWTSDISIVVDNEANLAALAQLWYDQEAIDHGRDFLHVSGEIGVGGGIVIDGQLFRGMNGYAGEIGHVVVDPRGERCHCGARGCLEQVAGKEAVLRRAGADRPLLDAALAGEEAVLDALGEAGRSLGLALADIINVIDIPVVCLGGFYAEVGEFLIEPISAVLSERVLSGQAVTVVVSGLDQSASVRGAAGAVMQRLIATPALP